MPPKRASKRQAVNNSAGDAISNTPALYVDLSTQRPNVPLPDLTQTTVQHQTCPPGVTVRDELLLSRGPTPVKPVQLAFYLRGYNNSISDYLIQGFVHGFSIRYLGSLIAMRSQNLKSAKDNPTSVTEKLSKELTAGRIVGPFDVPPFDPFRVSPLGIIPKKSPGEFRLIHHLSYPAGSSVNDGIPKELATVRYATIDDAIRLIKSLGKGCFLAKTDIKSAFRIIFVSPNDFPLLKLFYQSQCNAVALHHNDIRDNIFNLDQEALPRSTWLWWRRLPISKQVWPTLFRR